MKNVFNWFEWEVEVIYQNESKTKFHCRSRSEARALKQHYKEKLNGEQGSVRIIKRKYALIQEEEVR